MISFVFAICCASFVWATQYDTDQRRLTGRPYRSRLTVISGAASVVTLAAGFAL